MNSNVEGYRLVECKNAEELLQSISPIGTLFKNHINQKSHIFRGHSNSDWKLIPAAFRAIVNPMGLWGHERPIPPTERTNMLQIAYEIKKIIEFFKLADSSGLHIPEDSQQLRSTLKYYEQVIWGPIPSAFFQLGGNEWPPKEIWSLLAIAQHNGFPTRLLDWTWSSFTAAYFAAKDVVMNHNAIGNPKAIAIWAFHHRLEGADKIGNGYIHFVESPYAPNKNLWAQRGVHLLYIPINYDKDFYETDLDVEETHNMLEMLYRKNNEESNYDSLIKFVLPAEHAGELMQMLEKFNISAASLFPGYEGVVNALKEREYL